MNRFILISALLTIFLVCLLHSTSGYILENSNQEIHPENIRHSRKPRHENMNYYQKRYHYEYNPRYQRHTSDDRDNFDRYNDIHPQNERPQHPRFQNFNERDSTHKCLQFCKDCGSSIGNSYVCTEDTSHHKTPLSYMLFSNKCQMKCYNKCHNTNYRYSTSEICLKIMARLQEEEGSTKHPIRHEKHHIRINSENFPQQQNIH